MARRPTHLACLFATMGAMTAGGMLTLRHGLYSTPFDRYSLRFNQICCDWLKYKPIIFHPYDPKVSFYFALQMEVQYWWPLWASGLFCKWHSGWLRRLVTLFSPPPTHQTRQIYGRNQSMQTDTGHLLRLDNAMMLCFDSCHRYTCCKSYRAHHSKLSCTNCHSNGFKKIVCYHGSSTICWKFEENGRRLVTLEWKSSMVAPAQSMMSPCYGPSGLRMRL